jgi:hypothetical protein
VSSARHFTSLISYHSTSSRVERDSLTIFFSLAICRVAWPIRDDLVPLFGPTFPDTCLAPDQPGFGQVVPPSAGSSRQPASLVSVSATGGQRVKKRRSSEPVQQQQVSSGQQKTKIDKHRQSSKAEYASPAQPVAPAPSGYGNYVSSFEAYSHTRPESAGSSSGSRQPTQGRYSPYPSQSSSSSPSIQLPPIRQHSASPPAPYPAYSHHSASGGVKYALPPISALEDLRGAGVGAAGDPKAVLRRLREEDPEDRVSPYQNQSQSRLPPLLVPSRSGMSSSGSESMSSASSPVSPATPPPPTLSHAFWNGARKRDPMEMEGVVFHR